MADNIIGNLAKELGYSEWINTVVIFLLFLCGGLLFSFSIFIDDIVHNLMVINESYILIKKS